MTGLGHMQFAFPSLSKDTQSKIVGALLKLAQRATEGEVELAISPVELSRRVGLDVETVVLDRGEIVAEIRPQDMTVPELTEFLISLQHER